MIKVRKLLREHPEQKMMVAISGAFIFVLSSLKLPSVTGSSSHPTGTGMSAVLYGVAVSSLLSLIVLVFQALLLAHGGLTTLGANVFSMGIAGPLAAYMAFKGLTRTKVSLGVSVFIAAFLANIITYLITAGQLALAYPSGGSILASFSVFAEVFALTQVPLAIIEGIITAMFFGALARTRPELLETGTVRNEKRVSAPIKYAAALCVIVSIIVLALVLNSGGQFIGSDESGIGKILSISPSYSPWISLSWNIPSELQAPLFAVQAFIGIAIIAIIYTKFRRAKKEE